MPSDVRSAVGTESLAARIDAAFPGPPVDVSIVGGGELASWFATSELAVRSIAAAGRELARYVGAGGRRATPAVTVDRRLAAWWFKASARPVGWQLPPDWDALAGDYRGADGWIRLHTNAPYHRAATLRVLGCASERGAVEAAVAKLGADALEADVVAAGGAAARMRSIGLWREHPQGAAVRAAPLVARTSTAADGIVPSGGRGRPLQGLRVLDLTRVLAGPACTRFLAAFGAEVLRIDPPWWDEAGNLVEMTLGKRRAGLDLNVSDDRATFERLLRAAHVLVHGYRPGALDALGLCGVRRREANPALIDVSLSAYGTTGPWGGRRGRSARAARRRGLRCRCRSDRARRRATPAVSARRGGRRRALGRARGRAARARGRLVPVRTLPESSRTRAAFPGRTTNITAILDIMPLPVSSIPPVLVRTSAPASFRAFAALGAAASLLGACSSASLAQSEFTIDGSAGTRLGAVALAEFDAPWAMSFLPDGRALVTEKGGELVLVSADGERLGTIDGVPAVLPDGQGGLGDIVPHPDFADNSLVYLSWIERNGRDSGAVVGRATLTLTDTGGTLGPLERVWEQSPKLDSTRHYSHRIAFDGDGYLYVTSGGRGMQTPAQDLSNNLGTIVRLVDDGTSADGNPFGELGGAATQFWTVGHRNPLGIDVAPDGALWAHEMGPRGGDELNRIVGGENYGWPVVSDGENYSGVPIPDHATSDEYREPAISWVPSVSPAGLSIYAGELFEGWNGQALMGALSGRALLRVGLEGDTGKELERFQWGARVREVEEAPDGSVWVLEDQPSGRLLRLVPAS